MLESRLKQLQSWPEWKKLIWATFPVCTWIPKYELQHLRHDLFAGITSGITVIPQGLAYSYIAGLPPIYGLYCAIIPAFIYFFFGSSPQLIVGPTAVMSLLVGSTKLVLDTTVTNFEHIVFLLAFFSGIFNILFFLFRIGFLSNLVSHPVISGFTSAAALIIGVGQLPNFFGIKVRSNVFYLIVYDVFDNITHTNMYAFLLGLSSLVLLLLLRLSPKLRLIPGPLIVMIVATILSWQLNLHEHRGVSVVGEVPKGFPPVEMLSFDLMKGEWLTILGRAFIISIIGFMEAFSIGSTFAREFKYEINANSEFLAMGISNMIASFFSCYPATGSFSRTAVNAKAGAKTGFANLIAAFLVLMTLLFLTHLFYHLPMSVLAGIIIASVVSLLDYKEAIFLFKVRKLDLLVLLTTFIGTLWLGVELGIGIGVGVSILIVMVNIATPKISVVGNSVGNGTIAVVAMEESFVFMNTSSVKNQLQDACKKQFDNATALPRIMVLDMTACQQADTSAIHCLIDICKYLEQREVELWMVGVKKPIVELFHRGGITKFIPLDHFYSDIQTAVEDAQNYNQRPSLRNLQAIEIINHGSVNNSFDEASPLLESSKK